MLEPDPQDRYTETMSSPNPSRLLMIEDDARLAQMVTDYLGQSALRSRTPPMAKRGWSICSCCNPSWSFWT